MTIKKLKKYGITVVSALSLTLSAEAITLTHIDATFLANGTYVGLTNNTTWTNVNGTVPASTNTWYFSYTAGTNVLGGWTNSQGILIPQPFVDVDLRPDANADVNPNSALFAVINISTNLTLPFGMGVWPGGYGTNQPISYVQPTAGSTNTELFVFTRSIDGVNFGTAAQDQFSWLITPTNGVATEGYWVGSTNLPTSFLQGAKKLRVFSVTTGNNSSPGNVLDVLKLGQWGP